MNGLVLAAPLAAWPCLLEIHGYGTAEGIANARLELVKGIEAFGKTTNRITVICGGGKASVIDAQYPMRRVICVANGVRPRFGKLGLMRELEKVVEETCFDQKGSRLGIIHRLAQFVRRLGKQLHSRGTSND